MGATWAKLFGDSSEQEGVGVATDTSGNAVVTGYVNGSVDFGGGVLTSAGSADIFTVKLASSNGSYVWGRLFGDSSEQEGQAIATDPSDNVIVTGYFAGTVNFGGGTKTIPADDAIFVAKFTP